MPFVTEELWQRLPRRSSSQIQTIMKADYPTGVRIFSFPFMTICQI